MVIYNVMVNALSGVGGRGINDKHEVESTFGYFSENHLPWLL